MKNKTKQPIVIGLIILLSVIGQTMFSSTVNAAPTVTPVVQIQSYGASYGEWSARWWQWLLSIPAKTNPNLDPTGANCALGQHDDVWFLAGAFGGDITRTCTIPANKPIFFPIVNGIAFNPTGSDTLLDLRKMAGDFIDTVTELTVTIDGIPIPVENLFDSRVRSPSFTVMAPPKALLPPGKLSAPGKTDAIVSDGYWLLLQPFTTAGPHTIVSHGKTSDGFEVNLTYTLTVSAP